MLPDGARVRLQTRDRFHGRTGTILRRECVLPRVIWVVVEVDVRGSEWPFSVYVTDADLVAIDQSVDPQSERPFRVSKNAHPWRYSLLRRKDRE